MLEIVLLSRNRPKMAGDTASVILKQLNHNVSFWISDNSTSQSTTDYLIAKYPLVRIVRRGGYLSQFEHMSTVFSEITAKHAVIMHDDDMISPYFCDLMLDYISRNLNYGILLNKVLPVHKPCATDDLRLFGPYKNLSLRVDSRFTILDDYLLGIPFRGEYYSISMTLFNVSIARDFLPVLTSYGLFADAAFILAIAYSSGYLYNDTPSGLYYLGPSSISFTANFLDIRKFTHFLLTHNYMHHYRHKIMYYKFRYRFNLFSQYQGRPKALRLLGVNFLYYLFFSPFSGLLFLALFRRLFRPILKLLSI